MENRWLPVVQRLAREVDVRDYIHNIDSDHGRGGSPAGGWWRQAIHMVFGACVGTFVLIAAAYAIGYRIVGPQQQRLIDAVYRVDPNPDRWTEPQVVRRLAIRSEAMDLLEHAVASTPSSDMDPYIANLTGHPPALLDPGRSAGLVLLARAIDQVPTDQRGLLVDRVVSVGAALGDPDVAQAFQVLSALDPTSRRELFAQGAAGLKRIVSTLQEIDKAAAMKTTLQDQLNDLLKAQHQDSENIAKRIGPTQAWITALGRIDQQCLRASKDLYSYMSVARERLQK